MSTFQFGERLAQGVVVIKVKQAVAGNEEASFPPFGQFRDEIRWAGKLDVQGELILDSGD